MNSKAMIGPKPLCWQKLAARAAGVWAHPRVKVLISVVIGLSIWEIIGRLSKPIIFEPFSTTLVALWQFMLSGELFRHAAVTFSELVMGFIIGSIVGLAGGTLSAFNKTFRIMTDVWVSALYSVPYVALIPLFIVWFGIDIVPKVCIVFYAVFIPVWLNTYTGIIGVDLQLIELARSFGAKRNQTLRWVVLPFALPTILTGLRLAISRGFIAAIVGELVAATAGLGFVIDTAGATFQTDKLLASVVVLALISVALVELLKWFQRKTVPWWELKGGAVEWPS